MANTACLEEAVKGMIEREERREKLAPTEVLDRRPSNEWYFRDEIREYLTTHPGLIADSTGISSNLLERKIPHCYVWTVQRGGRTRATLCYHIPDWNILKAQPSRVRVMGNNPTGFPEGDFNANDAMKFWQVSYTTTTSRISRSCRDGLITRVDHGRYRKAEPTELPLEVPA